jgi:type II secretory pathway pseudopilin PulG
MRQFSRQRAFSMVEVLVTTAFLGICSAVIVDICVQSQERIVSNQCRRTMAAAASSELEKYVAQNRKSTSVTMEPTVNISLPGGETGTVVATQNTTSITKIIKISVVCSWNEKRFGTNYPVTETVETCVQIL